MDNLNTKDCIRTYTGLYMNVFEPTSEMICIEDIAHSLSQQCRFGGHLPRFFTVAQHCLNCCYLINDERYKLDALLHDASEAYLLDIPKPIKERLPEYKKIEHNLMLVIADKLGFQYPLITEIHTIDKMMLEYEWKHIMLGIESDKIVIHTKEEAKEKFINLFNYLTSKKIER